MARSKRDIEMRPEAAPRQPSTLKKIGWMALIWAASIAALGVVSLALRWWLK